MFNSPPFRYLIVVLTLALGLAILALSVMPLNRIALGLRPGPFPSHAAVEHAAHVHILVHILAFGGLAAIAWIAARLASDPELEEIPYTAIALVLTILLGCGTEYAQHVVYGNAVELNDVATNLISSLGVFGLITTVSRFRKKAS